MRLGLHLRLYLHPDALRDTDLFRPGGVSVSEMGRRAEESIRDQLLMRLNRRGPEDDRKLAAASARITTRREISCEPNPVRYRCRAGPRGRSPASVGATRRPARRDSVSGGEEGNGLYEAFHKAKEGDEQALNRMLETVRPVLLHEIGPQVRSATSASALAEELAQDALFRVAEGLPGCRARSEVQLRAWCRTIARHVVTDWYRRRAAAKQKRAPGELAEIIWRREVVGREGKGIETPGTDADQVERALGQLLLEAQEVLSEGTQEILRRRLLYGDIWRVAGEAIGTSPGGAKRRYQRATKRLRREVLQRIHQVSDDRLRRALLRRVGEEPS